ncbi:permease [Arthrobacter livingstonensis]|uniref:Permease n=1 Tax=Arthrobacter livingstonensis TaxID=670078 RepID=A0A2V5LFF4_9MICC|nr:FtsX-like permease family protein [Arthrobacter livingstonensis]PYI69484.1 permease [Arthrobacter livingstonensis]
MKTTIPILWMMSRPAPGNKAVVALPATAFALVTALLLIVLAGALSFFTHPAPADGFGTAGAYQNLALVALALLILPLLTLGGSAARLSARRRDERLSTLRLLGATPALVGFMAVVEATAVAVLGIAAGIVLYAAALPAVALIHFQGHALGLAGLWLDPLVVLATAAALIVLAAISAAVGMRQVALTPLGVRTRQKAPTVHWVRAALGAGAAVVLYLGMANITASGSIAAVVVILLAAFAGGLALLNLMGPYVLKWFAGRQVRRAATAVRLLAARTILESPKAAWRQVSGLAMTSFIAVVAGTGLAVLNGAGAGIGTAEANLYNDMRTGVMITVVASFLLVACSAGVNQAAAILDRRELYISLDRMGMPRTVMDAARKRAIMSPVRIVTVGSAVLSGVLLFPLTGLAMIFSPLSLLVIAGILAGGIGLIWLGLAASAPVLGRVLAGGSTAAD